MRSKTWKRLLNQTKQPPQCDRNLKSKAIEINLKQIEMATTQFAPVVDNCHD